jgi:hypothetical protein
LINKNFNIYLLIFVLKLIKIETCSFKLLKGDLVSVGGNIMNNLGNFLGYYTINPFTDEGFIKVYFYEKGINFEENIVNEIIDNEKLSKIFISINNDWKNIKKGKTEIIINIMNMISENEDFFKKFIIYDSTIDYSDVYYNLLKSKNLLIDIERKEFEKHIIKENIGNYYTENLEKINSSDTKFYKYKSENENYFFIMVINDKIKLGFGE